jgi:4-amino-4-deoxyprephenate dehydrogenase
MMSQPAPGPAECRCVVAGGGEVGTMFARHLADSGYHVDVVDASATAARGGPATRFEQVDITDVGPSLAATIRAADLVVLAVPEHVALAALDGVLRAMAPGALLADTLSVKQRIVAAARAARPDVQVVSLNPMFAPSLGIVGRPVAAVVVRDGPRARDLLRLISAWGGRVVRMTSADHDRRTAGAQALTHVAVLAFGLALRELRVPISELDVIAPPPHQMLLALLARIAGGSPEVYWDIQSANPHAVTARAALADSLRRLAAMVADGDDREFAAALGGVRAFFGPEFGRYRGACQRAFAALDHASR